MSSTSRVPRAASDVVRYLDLHGATAVVTGGAGPLGRPVAKALAMADAAVLVTDPSLDIAARTAAELREEVEGATVRAAQLDLADLGSVSGLVREYRETAQPLSLLILAERRRPSVGLRRTRDGFEELFGAQHLGQMALTSGLLPVLRRTPAARVITVTTAGHVIADVDYEDPNFLRRPYDQWAAYGQAQSASCLLAQALTQHYGADGVTFNVADPGFPLGEELLEITAGEPANHEMAAASLVWSAVAPGLDTVSGRYLRDFDIARPLLPGVDPYQEPFAGYLPRALDPASALRLWDLSRGLLGLAGFPT